SGKECLTGKGIKIGIIDTGVDYTHKDLGGCFGNNCKVAGGYDFINNDDDPMDDHGHGTHVAAIAGGNGVLKGVAPDAQIYAYKVLDAIGSGSFSNVIAAIERSVDLNNNKIPCENKNDYLDIISLSLGEYCETYSKDCGPDDSVSTAIDNAAVCTVAVIAAGNAYGYGTIGTPATARKAITVGATYKKNYQGIYWQDYDPKKDQITSFSSRGPVAWNTAGEKKFLIKPDIVAPGAIICAAQWKNAWNDRKCDGLVDEEHVQLGGTSMATPMVAGAIALLKQKYYQWNNDEIKMVLRSTGEKLIDPSVHQEYNIFTQGYGRLNIHKAVNFKGNPVVVSVETSRKFTEKFNITGTIMGTDLSYYVLYYAKSENPSEWIELVRSNKTSNKEIIYQNFNMENLDEGTYLLKLSAWNSFGEKSEDKTIIEKENTNIRKIISISYYNSKNPPAIYDNIIVWNDAWSVYMHNLLTRETRRLAGLFAFDPAIYKDKIVLHGNASTKNNFYDVYMYDLSKNEKKQITFVGNAIFPKIYGDKIVWEHFDVVWNIYMYDLSKNKEKQITSTGHSYFPKIYGDKIVFEEDRNSKTHLVLYDLLTNQRTDISTRTGLSPFNAHMYGDSVVFHNFLNKKWNIYIYNVTSHVKRQLTFQGDQINPQIYGDKIVWEDYNNGKWDIYLYDLSKNKGRHITNDVYPQYYPTIYKDNLLWLSNKDGKWALYMYQLSPPSFCGNNITEENEQCDGIDSLACPRRCSDTCTCLAPSQIVNNNSYSLEG
ncbi:MAG: S8 family serine peptidase, partial [Nanoarchaeota archaeon]